MSSGKGPLRLTVMINDKKAGAELDYHFTARVKLKGLLLDFAFRPDILEVDIRGVSMDKDAILTAIEGIRALTARKSFTSKIKIYGITIKVLPSSK